MPHRSACSKDPGFKFNNLVKVANSELASFRRKPESRHFKGFWMPDQVRHDEPVTFYDSVKFECMVEHHRTGLFLRFLALHCSGIMAKQI